MAERWYTIRRTYRVEDIVYVRASNAAEAKAKGEGGDYVDVSGQEPISDTRLGRARRIAVEDLPDDLQAFDKYGRFPE